MNCPYCNSPAIVRSTEFIYGKGRFYGYVYVCSNYPKCDSYVGCHKLTKIPKGTMANRELRDLRKRAHVLFDPLWKTGKINKLYPEFIPGMKNRNKAYKWLSEQMLISRDECHIGKMREEQIKKAIRILEHAAKKLD